MGEAVEKMINTLYVNDLEMNAIAPDKKFVYEILDIDSSVYPKHLQGTFDEVYGRFCANRDIYILLYDDKKMIGYLCLFPIKDSLYEQISNEDKLFDSNIPGEMLEQYKPYNIYKLYLISAVIRPEYQKKGLSNHLIKGFYKYILDKKKNNIMFSAVLSSAVTNDGKLFLERMGFKGKKELSGGFTLNELIMNDSVYNIAEEKFKMDYKADLYIMLPCSIQGRINVLHENEHNDSKLYIEELSNTAQVEFDSVLSSGIERSFLCKITLSCIMDERRDYTFVDYQDAFIILSQYKDTDFCLLTISMINVKVNLITYILDQASRGELLVTDENKDKTLRDWICKFGLKLTGKAFFALYTSEFPDINEIPFILSAEAFYNEKDYLIVSDTIKKCLNKNHAQYSYYDAFMSERGIINITKKYNKSYKDRLKTESKMIFIMELIILKRTAINIANDKVIEYTNKDVSTREILEILEGFAKSLPMWNIQHFKYFIAQEFTNKVESSFKVSRYLAEYEKSRTRLEQIVNMRKLINSEKETRIISYFVTILTIGQIIPIFKSIVNSFSDGWKNIINDPTPVVTLVLIIGFTIWFFWKKNALKQTIGS